MHIPGCDDRFPQFIADGNDLGDDFFQVAFILDQFLRDEWSINLLGHDFDIVIELGFCFRRFRPLLHHRLEYLPLAAGRSDQQIFPGRLQHTPGKARRTVIIIDVGSRNDFEQVFEPVLIFRQYRGVERARPFVGISAAYIFVQFVMEQDIVFLTCFFQEYPAERAGRLRIVDGTVMLFQADPVTLRQRIQTMGFQLRMQESGHLQRIDHRIHCLRHTVAFIAVVQEPHIETGVVGHQNGAFGEGCKLLQHCLFRLGIAHHLISDACQLDGRLR